MKEQKRIVVLRKQQGRLMRLFQREQLVEWSALSKRLQSDRDMTVGCCCCVHTCMHACIGTLFR